MIPPHQPQPQPQPQALFLAVVAADQAHARWWAAAEPRPLEAEEVALDALAGRVLAEPIAATVDVPGFDRSNVDGYAVVASDTYGASEAAPVRLSLADAVIATGAAPTLEVDRGLAVTIATGGVIPRGADAVVMVEDTDLEPPEAPTHLLIRRPAIPGAMITFAGADITRGEVVLRPGRRLGPRETGVIAALGRDRAFVHRRPRVAILSTGDELVAPGAPRPLGAIHDCNQAMLADTCAELGALPLRLGIVGDDLGALRGAVDAAIHRHRADLILLSGGTSKGAGDLCVRALAELPGATPGAPAVVVHGVAIKPGKPLCLAATRHTDGGRPLPLAVLPGFPTSALFTFHEFVAPLLRALLGLGARSPQETTARLAQPLRSERGRREFALVQLVTPTDPAGPDRGSGDPVTIAHPLGKGSGSVTAFARADGFFAIDAQVERVDAGEAVIVERIDGASDPWDLRIIGSHCTGLERIADHLHRQGLRVQILATGSQGGLQALADGLCDIAPIHLCDPISGRYNLPFVPPGAALVAGYGRMQGLLFRAGDRRFAGTRAGAAALPAAVFDPAVIMVNRNRGSGTRLLIDRLVSATREAHGLPGAALPRGYFHEARSHRGVAACVVQGRADWGIAIAGVAGAGVAGFIPLQEERYDFVVADRSRPRPAVQRFLACLADPTLRRTLTTDGFL